MTDHFTLHEAADQLGVHYMTAYRYVRTGMLDATKVGGTWRVSAGALERLRDGTDTGPVEAGEPAPWSDRFESRLVAGDAGGAWGVVQAALTAGAGLDEVYLNVVTPAMVRIGERWEAGELDVAVEHRASGIAMRIVGRLGPRCVRRGRTRGRVVLGAPAGEFHSLPIAILSDMLRLEGWEVSDLGVDVPNESYAYVLREFSDVAAVGLSVTSEGSIDALGEAVVAIRATRPDVLLVVGGRAIAGWEHALAVGADGYADGGPAMSALLAGHARGEFPDSARPAAGG